MIKKLYIDGSWVTNVNNETFSVYNPTDMKELAKVPLAGFDEAKLAIDAASRALPAWSNLSGKERSHFIRKLFNLMERDKEKIAKIIVGENGKVLKEAISEVEYALSFVEWFAEEAKRIYGEVVPTQKQGQKLFTIKQPIGVVAAITPWNFPLAMIVRKLSPALAAGCTMIIKPSEETPLSALKLAELCQEAGIPNGVVNIICGNAKEIGKAFTSDKKIKMLTFTGSTAVGKLLATDCASTVKKVTLELGGNAPYIVFEDANIDQAVDALIAVKLRSGGQSCICANRIFLHQSIINQFTTELINKFKKISVGDGLDEKNQLGPLINIASVNKINSLLSEALNNGSELLYEGEVNVDVKDCFIAPSIILNHKKDLSIETTEIFGPIISIFSFEDEEEVIKRANDTNYGLAAYFFTENKNRIWRVSEALEYGMVGINDVGISSEMACFGGVKESGLGREGGKQGILEYLEDKYLVIS